MNKKIIEVSPVEGEKVYLKKDFMGWRVVEPPSKWYHYIIGNKRNAYLLLFLAILGVFSYIGIKELIASHVSTALQVCYNNLSISNISQITEINPLDLGLNR